MNEDNAQYAATGELVKNFVKNYEDANDKNDTFKNRWQKNIYEGFVKFFNDVNKMALKNLSEKNVVVVPNKPERDYSKRRDEKDAFEEFEEYHVIVATDNGLRMRSHYGVQSDDLNLTGILYAFRLKADIIEKWITENKPKRLAQFKELREAIASWSFVNKVDRYSSSRYGNGQYDTEVVVPDELREVVATDSSNTTEHYIIEKVEFTNDNSSFYVKFVGHKANGASFQDAFTTNSSWDMFPYRRFIHQVSEVFDIVDDKMDRTDMAYFAWITDCKKKLSKYASLLAL